MPTRRRSSAPSPKGQQPRRFLFPSRWTLALGRCVYQRLLRPARSRLDSLVRSSRGQPPRYALDRRYLAHALSLGLREVRTCATQAPILFRDERRSYLVASLDSRSPAVSDATEQPPVTETPSIRSLPRRGDERMNPERNGPLPTEHASAEDVLDPLAEAEALRAILPRSPVASAACSCPCGNSRSSGALCRAPGPACNTFNSVPRRDHDHHPD